MEETETSKTATVTGVHSKSRGRGSSRVTGVHSKRGRGFSRYEDENICKAWVTVKQDPLDVKSSFPDSVLDVYNERMGAFSQRTLRALAARWTTIQQNLTNFCAYLELETDKDPSASLETRIIGAKRMFYASQKFAFKWDDCWEILKDNVHWRNYQEQKLSVMGADKKLKRTKLDDIIDANKLLKPTLENDSIDFVCTLSTPTSPRLRPGNLAIVPCSVKMNPISSVRFKEKEKENENKEKEQTVNLSTFVPVSSVQMMEKENEKNAEEQTVNLPTFDIETNPVSNGQTKEKEIEKKDEEKTVDLSKFVDETNLLWKTFMSTVDERLEKIEDIARRNVQLKEEKLRQKQLEMRESQFERDRQIMDMNLEHMPIMQRQFYEMKQREICERWRMGEPISAGEGSSGELEFVQDPE